MSYYDSRKNRYIKVPTTSSKYFTDNDTIEDFDNTSPSFIPTSGTKYPYYSRDQAHRACAKAGFARLCNKTELEGHSKCDAGWLADWYGYWMGHATGGCGNSYGYQSWGGPNAGAYCCDSIINTNHSPLVQH